MFKHKTPGLMVLISMILMVASTVTSEIPKRISYQGRATDASGNPVADGVHDAWFFLYTSSSGATYVWSDNASIQTSGGLFNYILGSDPAEPLPDSIFTKYDSLFLGVVFDGEQLTPLTPLTASPYAFRVNSIDGAKGGGVDGYVSFRDTVSAHTYAYFSPDLSGNGAGFFQVMRNGGTSPALYVDGNYLGQGSPLVSIEGSTRQAIFNMGVSGNSSVVLPSNAIHSLEMANEAGVGSYINQSGYYVSSGVTYLGSRAMFSPSDGFVLAIATAEIQVYHSSGTLDQIYFGLTDNCGTMIEATKILLQISSIQLSGVYFYPLTVHGLFPVDSGTTTFCFQAQPAYGTCQVENIAITELFVPTAYTTVIQPSAAVTPGEPENERLVEQSFHDARLQAELEEMKAEMEVVKAELEALKETSDQE